MYFEIRYTDFLKNRVVVVTEAETKEVALEKVVASDRLVASPYVQKISEVEFNKFTKTYKAI